MVYGLNTDKIKADVVPFLEETVELQTRSVSFGTMGKSTVSYTKKSDIKVCIQPAKTDIIQQLAEMQIVVDYVIYLGADVVVGENDRIKRSDGSFIVIKQIEKQPNHIRCYGEQVK